MKHTGHILNFFQLPSKANLTDPIFFYLPNLATLYSKIHLKFLFIVSIFNLTTALSIFDCTCLYQRKLKGDKIFKNVSMKAF